MKISTTQLKKLIRQSIKEQSQNKHSVVFSEGEFEDSVDTITSDLRYLKEAYPGLNEYAQKHLTEVIMQMEIQLAKLANSY